MSFSRSINIDQLPDARIHNPLRGKPKRGRPPLPPAPSQPQAAGPPPQTPRGGLFSRIVPPARPAPPDDAADSGSDSDDDEASDASEDEEPQRRRPARAQKLASGPFAKVANTNKHSFQFVAAFKDVSGSLSKSSASVTIQFTEVLRHADAPDAFSRLDARRTIPIYVRVSGTSLAEEFLRVCTLEVYDAAGKPLFSKFVHKANNSETATTTGYPLFLFAKGEQNNIFFHPPELSSDHKTYWTFTMETLEKNTSMFVNPTTGEQYVIIKKDSGCAKLMQYALSERNDIVRNPNLLDHPLYQNPNDPDNIRLPIDMYNKTKQAYRKKLGEIAATSYDLSSVRVVLKPMELAKEMWKEHERSPGGSSAVPNVNHVWGHVALEIFAHIGSVDEESSVPDRSKTAPPADDGSDEDL